MLNSNIFRPRVASRWPRGFTLVELMISVVLLGLVVGGLLSVIVRQQHFQLGTQSMMETRGSVRQALDILPAEIRGVSAPGGDITLMEQNAIEYRAPIGSSVVCTIDATRRVITVPPMDLATRSGLTAGVSIPQQGDSLFVFNERANIAPTDDTWDMHAIAAEPTTDGNCPMATGFTTTVADAVRGWTVTLDTPLAADVTVGSMIRFVRSARYELYQGGDGKYYLGYSCSTACAGVQPVSGPYIQNGLRFAYFDTTGAPALNGSQVHRVEIRVHARGEIDMEKSGISSGYHEDSLAAQVAIRNRS